MTTSTDPWKGLYRPSPGVQRDWIAWCSSAYTMDLCRRVRDLLRADGWTVRIDHRGRHLAGDGEYHAFGKIYFRGDTTNRETAS